MVFEDVEIGPEEYGKYWNPEEVGDSIEGNVCGFDEDNYGNKRIILDMGDDENGNIRETRLPTHTHLRRYYENIGVGDYIRVELVKIIPPKKEGNNPAMKYNVQKDPERHIEYND